MRIVQGAVISTSASVVEYKLYAVTFTFKGGRFFIFDESTTLLLRDDVMSGL